MPRPYSLDLRERVVTDVKAGLTCRQAAAKYSIGISTAVRWAGRERSTGSPAALPMGGKRPYVLAGQEAWLRRHIAERPDITLHELLAELASRKVQVSYFGLWNFCAHLGLSFKKNSARQRAGPPRRGAAARAMAAPSGQDRSQAAGVHR